MQSNYRNFMPMPASSLLVSMTQAKLSEAISLHRRGLLREAHALYESILTTQPRHADALHLLGVLAAQTGNHQHAADLIDKAIEINPRNAAFHVNLGNALKELRLLEAAIECYDRAINLKPDLAEAWNNRGNALKERHLLRQAIDNYREAISLRPDYAEAHYNLGNTLAELKQLEEAVASYDEALRIKADHSDAWLNRGNSLKALKRLDAAIASYDEALNVRPGYAEALLNKSFALLLKGDFEQGWALHECRWKTAKGMSEQVSFTQPLWSGVEPLQGKTIVLHCEQGFGDTIQFCRYAKLVAMQGARVIAVVPKTLVGLLQVQESVEWFVERSALPAFDYYCPFMSLPWAFKTSLASIPKGGAYLRSDSDKVMQWADCLGVKTKPRIGLMWSGNPDNANDRNRSVPLLLMLEHLPAQFDYVSLQKELSDGDRDTLEAGTPIRYFGNKISDFSDTAALCELVDLVVSVDTGVAHLAAALGKPTWILLPHSPDWRWLLDRDDSPWYPTAKLYRQSADFDWSPVLERVGADLSLLA